MYTFGKKVFLVKQARQIGSLQQFEETISNVLSRKKNPSCSKLGEVRRYVRRWAELLESRQRRLYPQKRCLSGCLYPSLFKVAVSHLIVHGEVKCSPPFFLAKLWWEGRIFQCSGPAGKIYSDSPTQGWGALYLTSGIKLQELWRSEHGLHINIKELSATQMSTLF